MTKTHRVGTVTLGGMLVVFGALFLLRIFFHELSYEIIFKLWPVVFIFLGLEILLANFVQKEEKLVYDKTAFALIIILSFFAMGMAITELFLDYASTHMTVTW
jgi:UDP-N-acetylmuramyl pentapeptide phosphotransferase/UDP-N-acetylglucosamine-1-phosphate transferase